MTVLPFLPSTRHTHTDSRERTYGRAPKLSLARICHEKKLGKEKNVDSALGETHTHAHTQIYINTAAPPL